MLPAEKSEVVWENDAPRSKASPTGVSPVGRKVLAATTRAKRPGRSPSRRRPSRPPQSWQNIVMSVSSSWAMGGQPVRVAGIAVVGLADRLVGTAEADQVRRDDPVAGRDQTGDHPAVEIAPARLAVEQQHRRRIVRPLVDVVHAKFAAFRVVDEQVVRRVRPVGQRGEAVVGGAQVLHRDSPGSMKRT
jgi:hypothetical protein